MADMLDREASGSRRWTRALAIVVIAALALAVVWLLLLTD
jgi:hypothetical protein